MDLCLYCPVCLSEQLASCSDDLFRKCLNCSLVFQVRLPADPMAVYTRDNYDAARAQVGLRLGVWERFQHDRGVALKRMQQLSHVLPGPSPDCLWVDVGCGSGGFISLARQIGYSVIGVETDPAFCKDLSHFLIAAVETSYEFFIGCTPEAQVISFFDVLEHVADPFAVVSHAGDNLAAGGCLVFEFPDIGQHLDENLETFSHHKPDEHLFHFSSPSLEMLRSKALPSFERVHEAIPIAGKLQVVWKKPL